MSQRRGSRSSEKNGADYHSIAPGRYSRSTSKETKRFLKELSRNSENNLNFNLKKDIKTCKSSTRHKHEVRSTHTSENGYRTKKHKNSRSRQSKSILKNSTVKKGKKKSRFSLETISDGKGRKYKLIRV